MKKTLIFLLASVLVGCAGTTGQVGTPIATDYSKELDQIKIGKTTPEELKEAFKETTVSLREKKDNTETWEVFKPGSLDAGAFVLWGYIAHDKDQSMLFHFKNGKLTSYESLIHEPKAKS